MPDGIHQFAIGNVSAWVISDGETPVDGGSVFGATPRREWQLRTGPPDNDYCLQLGLNCLLLRSDERLILVDTGLGPGGDEDGEEREGEGGGKLLWNLAAMGIPPADIDIVVNTHLHPDHAGWNTRRSDRGWIPVFPNASYYIQRSEWDFWTHPQQLSETTFARRGALPLEAAGRLKLVRGETALTDEVRLVPTPGHTPGHQSVVIRSGREAAIFAGDLAHHPSMLERHWTSGFDLFPLESKQTKRATIDQILRESMLVIGPHFAFPGTGRLIQEASSLRWVEEDGTSIERSVEGRSVRNFRLQAE
jgi:glyoxylase-like metal-dependent hydrolase (beta-lactamase superfamily II)